MEIDWNELEAAMNLHDWLLTKATTNGMPEEFALTEIGILFKLMTDNKKKSKKLMKHFTIYLDSKGWIPPN